MTFEYVGNKTKTVSYFEQNSEYQATEDFINRLKLIESSEYYYNDYYTLYRTTGERGEKLKRKKLILKKYTKERS